MIYKRNLGKMVVVFSIPLLGFLSDVSYIIIRGDLLAYSILLNDFAYATESGIGSFSLTEPLFLAYAFAFSKLSHDVITFSIITSFLFFLILVRFFYFNTDGASVKVFIVFCVLVFLYKYQVHYLLIKQTIALSVFFYALTLKRFRSKFFFIGVSCLFHNMAFLLAAFYAVSSFSLRYYSLFFIFVALLISIENPLLSFINRDDIYTLPPYYLFLDIFIFISAQALRLKLPFLKFVCLLFLVVHFSYYDLLSIRFEFVLHPFRMLYVGLIISWIISKAISSERRFISPAVVSLAMLAFSFYLIRFSLNVVTFL